MKTEQHNLDRFNGKNPFIVPEGYMEGLTANIMDQLPEKSSEEEAKAVTLMQRIRPWLYMAAVFAGMGLFFNVLVAPVQETDKSGSLLVKTDITANQVSAMQAVENEEYLEYIEDQYAGYILAGDMTEFE